MDDPWGSPWTSSTDHAVHDGSSRDSTNNDSNGTATTDSTPKAPQPAVLVDSAVGLSGNTPFASLPEPSPWADDNNDDDFGGFQNGGGFDDDNAFGDWTAPAFGNAGSVIGSSASGWGGFGGEPDGGGFADADEGAAQAQFLTPRKKSTGFGGLGQLSPIAWPSSAALSPAGSPGSRSPSRRRALSRSSAHGSIGFARSPSQGPWATSVTTADSKAAEPSSTHGIPILRLDENEATPAPVIGTPDNTPQIVAGHIDDRPAAAAEPAEPEHEAVVAASTRPSSAGSGGSTHSHADDEAGAETDDPQQDSPTTSIEDMHAGSTTDTTDTADAMKTSSKVQGLVELYDGLSTRPASIRTLSGSTSRAASGRHGSVVSDKGAEAADAIELSTAETTLDEQESPTSDETVTALAAEPAEPAEVPEATSRTDEESEEEEEEEEAPGLGVAEPEKTETIDGADADVPQEPKSDATADPSKQQPPPTKSNNKEVLSVARILSIWGEQTPYKADLSKVDKLYPDPLPPIKEDKEKPPLDAFIPDYILDDSFTSISERKVWYRIARHGSARKHNMGGGTDDDNNYRPITWRTSVIRDDTVKIVRRWMEEDSFTGKPTLGGGFGSGGGGSGGGNLFGWDSAAAPVSLDEVFKKKKNRPGAKTGHQKTLSTASSTWAFEGNSSGSPDGFSPGFSAGGFSAAPVFGWGSGPASARNSMQSDRPSPVPAAAAASAAAAAVMAPPKPKATTPQLASNQPSRFSVILPPADLSLSLPVAENSPVRITADDEEDDDDWGEMISSPTAESHIIPAPPFFSAPMPASAPPPAPASTPAPTAALLDDRDVAVLADSILRGLPDLSYMAV
ncbi:hypothetical protein SCUCBS95973_002972 [Sporothrix curviconia]|uniref:Glucan 1, 4-alpha-glucosidase n=1 Tax=Sporothrix curviconia TaxID=1260050 RepID=A0ABP0BBC4_9PEZI